MGGRHLMLRTDGNGRESLFECTDVGCGRRLVFDHVGARLVVLEPGTAGALHHGYSGPVGLTVDPCRRPFDG